MITVKLASEVVKELRVLKAEVGAKSYSELLKHIIKYYKDTNNG